MNKTNAVYSSSYPTVFTFKFALEAEGGADIPLHDLHYEWGTAKDRWNLASYPQMGEKSRYQNRRPLVVPNNSSQSTQHEVLHWRISIWPYPLTTGNGSQGAQGKGCRIELGQPPLCVHTTPKLDNSSVTVGGATEDDANASLYWVGFFIRANAE
ncbi:hypothetical protein AJ79_01223 [Helicocarpus griseus UAMH5409]|uniref:Uncharacterized protein n=1 Tax=Helicocarpus griseus UAMH5409 TaxID=1447875 RepID=A0A2B7Y8B3_9EURO|nr:hypothetical protein AJ79_01223 [Helicocarpus griseus UAMH5409]